MCIITSTTAATVAAITSAVIAAVSTSVSTVAAVQSGKAQQEVYNYQAEENKRNAEIAQANATQERQSGIEEARKQRIKTLQNIGSQQTAMAANGIDISSGTALDVIEDTASAGELDALMLQYNSERTAQNYERTANNYNNQANLDIIAGQNARTASYYNAGTTALNGLSGYVSDNGVGLKNTYNKVSDKWSLRGKYSGGLDSYKTIG